MYLNDNAAIATAKELTITAMENNMIKVGNTSELTAKNVTDFFFATKNALTGKNTDKA